MHNNFIKQIQTQLDEIKNNHLFKEEKYISSRQQALITLNNNKQVLNLCANNYLDLAHNQEIISKAKSALDKYGYGTASVRFICGTMDIHQQLENTIAQYLGMDAAITYAACFDANGGVFEPLFNENDAIISDRLNHASIIDGIRLCKAKRFLYENNNMEQLEKSLKEARNNSVNNIIIVTDGVFSMDGIIADLQSIKILADKYNALIMVDDSHSIGVLGKDGSGTPTHHNLFGKIDIITGTFGKALGGAMGGFTCSTKPVIELLRQRSRPYLFSNALSPSLCAGAITAIDIAKNSNKERKHLFAMTDLLRTKLSTAGFKLTGNNHPIIPIMLYDAKIAQKMAAELFTLGIYVTSFSFPVVPKDKARIRVQISAGLNQEQIIFASEQFISLGEKYGVI